MSRGRIDGMNDLKKSLDRLGALPQKVVTGAAKKGAKVWLNAVKATAPEDTGALKSGIVLKGEKTRKKGKKVYDVTFDSGMNDVFAKEHVASANSSVVTNKNAKPGEKARAYYPASQEFGYITKNGGYEPGLHYMRDAAIESAPAAEIVIVSEMTKKIDKEWNKKNGN